MVLTMFETPLLLAGLLVPPAPQAPPPADAARCGTTLAASAIDCCLHLATWSTPASQPLILLPAAQNHQADERTKTDVEIR